MGKPPCGGKRFCMRRPHGERRDGSHAKAIADLLAFLQRTRCRPANGHAGTTIQEPAVRVMDIRAYFPSCAKRGFDMLCGREVLKSGESGQKRYLAVC